MGLEGTYLSIIQVVYDKSTANIILNGEKLKAFPRSEIGQIFLLTILFNIVLKILATAIIEGKKKSKLENNK